MAQGRAEIVRHRVGEGLELAVHLLELAGALLHPLLEGGVELADLGVGLVAGQKREAPQFHMFYGFVAFIAVGILYSYRQQLRGKVYLLYGFGGLFVMGLGIRAFLKA